MSGIRFLIGSDGDECSTRTSGYRTSSLNRPRPSGTSLRNSDLSREAAAQQNQSGLEVALDIWRLEALVEANLAVRELDTLLAVQKPEQASTGPVPLSLLIRYASVQEDAVV